MSRQYKQSIDVPNAVLAIRLRELYESAKLRDWNAFTMRIPAEVDRDYDLVMCEAARRLDALQSVEGPTLAPCGACGSKIVTHSWFDGMELWGWECTNPRKASDNSGCGLHHNSFETERDAIEHANRRAIPTPIIPEKIAEAVERVRYALYRPYDVSIEGIPALEIIEAALISFLATLDTLRAQQPRIWTAETIGVAPKGWYFCGFGFEPEGWSGRTMQELSRVVDLLKYYAIDPHGLIMKAWGPLPLPPSPVKLG